MNVRFRRIAVVLAICAAVSGSARAATGEPYEIHAILSLNGGGAFLGQTEATALTIVEENTNSAGGISGRPIKFVIHDDQSSPQVAVQLFNAILTKGVPIVLGSTQVGACNAMAAIAKNGPVLYCLSAAPRPAKGSFEFTYGVAAIDSMATDLFYLRNRGWTKAAIITTTDATGQEADRALDEVLARPENRTIAVVDREHYNPTDVSVSAQIERIKASGAQYVIAWPVGAPFGTFLRGATDAALDLPVVTGAGNLSYAEMKQFAAILPKELYFSGVACVVYDSLPNGRIRTAVKAFVDSFKAHGVEHPDLANAIAWDPALLTVQALKTVGLSATPEAIRAYLAQLHDWVGANGEYDFRDGSQRGLAGRGHSIMVRWDPPKDTWVAVSGFGGVPK